MNLKEAREKGKMEQFILEHEKTHRPVSRRDRRRILIHMGNCSNPQTNGVVKALPNDKSWLRSAVGGAGKVERKALSTTPFTCS